MKEFRASTIAEDKETIVGSTPVDADNQLIRFPATTSQRWRLDFKPGKSNKVALRGLQFYYHDTELFAAVTSDEDAELLEQK